jgi:hypothetical protein
MTGSEWATCTSIWSTFASVRIAEANSLKRGAEASFLSLPAASTRTTVGLHEASAIHAFLRQVSVHWPHVGRSQCRSHAKGIGWPAALMSPVPGCARPSSLTSLRRPPDALG